MNDDVRVPEDPNPERDLPGVHGRYDWSRDHPTTAVVETVSRALDRDPVDLLPLYDRIETDALDELFCSPPEPPVDVSVSFTYLEREVTVRGDGLVVVQSIDIGH